VNGKKQKQSRKSVDKYMS